MSRIPTFHAGLRGQAFWRDLHLLTLILSQLRAPPGRNRAIGTHERLGRRRGVDDPEDSLASPLRERFPQVHGR